MVYTESSFSAGNKSYKLFSSLKTAAQRSCGSLKNHFQEVCFEYTKLTEKTA